MDVRKGILCIRTPSAQIIRLDGKMNDQIPLKDYMDMRFQESDKRLHDAHASMEKRLDGMNEFRETLKDSQSTFITKDEALSMHENSSKRLMELSRRMELLEALVSNWQGRLVMISILPAVIPICVTLFLFWKR